MNDGNYKNGVYHCEGVPLPALAAQVGTPTYVYSETMLQRHCDQLLKAFASYPTLACFAVKSLSNLSVLQRIFAAGLGADLVSEGELQRATLAGVKSQQIVFSGVGKKADEIRAALAVDILMFNVESAAELALINELARAAGKRARIALRVNPNIDAKTNEKIATGLYTTKFGIPEPDIAPLILQIKQQPNLELVGLACHIGSQITELQPLRDAARRMVELAGEVQAAGTALQYLNIGGGLGIRYHDETPPSLEDYGRALIDIVRPTGLKLIIEPGRVLVGNIGVLLTRVISVKSTPTRQFVVLDAAMNDLLRPTLYGSYHDIQPVIPVPGSAEVLCDFVGPICETGDFIAKGRLTALPKAGDLYVIRSCGAYASSMASQYNSRPRAPEILVQGNSYRMIRERETLASLWVQELAGLADQ